MVDVETKTSFLASKTLAHSCIISFFVIVVTSNFTYVPLLSFLVINLCYIDFGDRINRIPLIFLLLLLFIFFNLIGRLEIFGESRHESLGSLGFVSGMIFHRFLSLNFVKRELTVKTYITVKDLSIIKTSANPFRKKRFNYLSNSIKSSIEMALEILVFVIFFIGMSLLMTIKKMSLPETKFSLKNLILVVFLQSSLHLVTPLWLILWFLFRLALK